MDRTPFDLDGLYRDIGRFVVAFQVLENQIWQLGVQALGVEDYDRSRRSMTGYSFNELCRRAERAVFERLDRASRPAPEYRERLHNAIDRCHALRRYRNRMVHSAYVFLEGGGELVGVLRSDISKGEQPDGLEFDQEAVDAGSFEEAIVEIAAVAFELSLCRTQLIGWTG